MVYQIMVMIVTVLMILAPLTMQTIIVVIACSGRLDALGVELLPLGYAYIYIYIYTHMHTYVYMQRERERDIYIYIYIYII